jgi:hypothetical protein
LLVVDTCSEIDNNKRVGYEWEAIDDGFGGAVLDILEIVLRRVSVVR